MSVFTPPGIVTDGLVLSLHAARAKEGLYPGLNSPLTTPIKDLTGLGHDGTLTGFAGTTSSGYAGSGTAADPYRLVFYGDNDYVALPALHACDDKVFSYEAWFMRSGAPSAMGYVIDEANAANANTYPRSALFVYTDGKPHFFVVDANNANVSLIGPASVCDGAPHHIVGTGDGTYARLYVDDVLVAGPTALPAGALGPTGWTTIGALRANSTPGFWYYLSGGLAVARIYDGHTLSAAEVAQNYAAGYLWPYVTNPLLDGNLSLLVGGVEYAGKKISITDCQDAAPGGDASLSFTLHLSATDSPFALATNHPELATDTAVVLSHAGTTLFAGQICNDPTIGYAGEKAYVEVECDGLLGKAKRRGDYLAYWRDRSFEAWKIHRASHKSASLNTEGQLRLEVPKGIAVGGVCEAAAWYIPLGGLTSDEVGYVTFDWQANLGNDTSPRWQAFLMCDTDYLDSIPAGTFTDFAKDGVAGGGIQSGSAVVALPSGFRFLELWLSCVAEATTAAARYIALSALTVHRGGTKSEITAISVANPTVITTSTPHGLQTNGHVIIGGTDSTPALSGQYTATRIDDTHFSVPINVTVAGTTGYCVQVPTVTVDTVMTEIATGSGLATTSDTAGIGASLDEAIIREPTTRADALAQFASQYAGQVDWRFRGTQFICKPRETVAATIRALATCYLVDATTPGVTYDVRPDPEVGPDYVRVLYACLTDATYPDGTIRSVIRPSDPGWSAATARVLTLDYSDRSMTAAQAQSVADQALLWYSTGDPPGTITIETPTVPVESGGTLLTPYIRAGDWIEASNVPGYPTSTKPLYITGRSLDVDSGAVTLTVGGRGDEFNPVLASRRNAILPALPNPPRAHRGRRH